MLTLFQRVCVFRQHTTAELLEDQPILTGPLSPCITKLVLCQYVSHDLWTCVARLCNLQTPILITIIIGF